MFNLLAMKHEHAAEVPRPASEAHRTCKRVQLRCDAVFVASAVTGHGWMQEAQDWMSSSRLLCFRPGRPCKMTSMFNYSTTLIVVVIPSWVSFLPSRRRSMSCTFQLSHHHLPFGPSLLVGLHFSCWTGRSCLSAYAHPR